MVPVAKLFAKKVLTVSAIQYPGQLTKPIKDFLGGDFFCDEMGLHVVITGGVVDPSVGHWFVRDENGVLSVLHPNTFAERYAEIAE